MGHMYQMPSWLIKPSSHMTERKGEDDEAAQARLVLKCDVSLMLARDLADDGKAKACPLPFMPLHKTLKQHYRRLIKARHHWPQ